MPHDSVAEARFLEALPAIERIVASLCRRHGLRGDDADDFASWVRVRLMDDDYAVIRSFRGESSLGTYLTVVIAMLFRDHRIRLWGRWRPSAAARRNGTLAIQLERMVHRDGCTLDEAAETLRSRGETTASNRELGALLARLPERPHPRPVPASAEALATVAATDAADDTVTGAERQDRRATLDAMLDDALAHLAPQDRIILRMRFWEGSAIADIARALGVPQKPLYRQIERALRDVRKHLLQHGLSEAQARELLAELDA